METEIKIIKADRLLEILKELNTMGVKKLRDPDDYESAVSQLLHGLNQTQLESIITNSSGALCEKDKKLLMSAYRSQLNRQISEAYASLPYP